MRLIASIGLVVSATALALAVPQAHADSYRYNYSFYDPGIGYYTFVYNSPSLITSDETFLTTSSCTALGTPCSQVAIKAVSGEVDIYGANSLSDPGHSSSFFQVGSNMSGFSSLTIAQELGTTPVPEPSTLALLITGTLVMATLHKVRRLG